MRGIHNPGDTVWIQEILNPKGKLRFKLQFVETDNLCIGANTHNANTLVYNILNSGKWDAFPHMHTFHKEVPYGPNSRLDFLIKEYGDKKHYVEVKNVHYKEQNSAYFPDSVSTRATKHIHELIKIVSEGDLATIIFIIQRPDIQNLKPAWHIDPVFAETLQRGYEFGVRLLAYVCTTSPKKLEISRQVPILLEKEMP